MPDRPLAPWAEFLGELDRSLSEEVTLHCAGGFALTAGYNLPRPTADVDYIAVVPQSSGALLQQFAGQGSPLARRHRLYLQYVAVATPPDNYQDRLREVFAGCFHRLRLFVLDPYDLLLTKLERNSPKDREDVAFLARTLLLKPDVLRKRYQDELRPYLSRQSWNDQTLEMWIESFFPPESAVQS